MEFAEMGEASADDVDQHYKTLETERKQKFATTLSEVVRSI